MFVPKPSSTLPVELLRYTYRMFHPQALYRLALLSSLSLALAVSGSAASGAAAAGVQPDSGTALQLDVTGQVGGRLVAALGAEPRTLHPLLAIDRPSFTVARRLHGSLVRIDGASHRSTEALATSWQHLDDGRRLRLRLRQGVRFSDGDPFDADDVLFTFQVYLDPEVASPNRDLLIVQGQPIRAEKIDPHTIDLHFAAPYAVGERLLDGLLILPSHRLRGAYEEGKILESWGLDSSPQELVGLGPFRFVRYLPGQRLELERNPHYWKVDRNGQALPYLDQLTFVFAASQEAQVLRFERGDIHLISPLSSESFQLLERSRQRPSLMLQDIGPGLAYNFLFFNLNPVDPEALPKVASKQRWFRQRAFRQAVSTAIDRQALIRLVFRGRASLISSHVSSGNRLWIHSGLPLPERSLPRARKLLQEAGFSWREDGGLMDGDGQSVTFTLATSSSNAQRLDMATLIQKDLEDLGMEVQVVPLEFRALINRLTGTFDYDASLLALGGGDVDPNSAMGVWKSDGSNHLWHLGQEKPASPWEAEIDDLLERQLVTLDVERRKALYDRVQEIAAEQLPFIFLVSRNILVGARRQVGNFQPSIVGHPTLWNVDTLFLHSADKN